jgi:hypothetical protein
LWRTGRSDGQDVHAPESSGVEHVPQEEEQGRQVPLVPIDLKGQVGIHAPLDAKVSDGHRVQVVAVPMQDKQAGSHPSCQWGTRRGGRGAHVDKSHCVRLIQWAESSLRCRSGRIGQIARGSCLGRRNM